MLLWKYFFQKNIVKTAFSTQNCLTQIFLTTIFLMQRNLPKKSNLQEKIAKFRFTRPIVAIGC